MTADRRILRYGGATLALAVWALLIFSPRQGGLTASYVLTFTALLGGLALVDLTASRAEAPWWQRAGWLAAELVLAYAVVHEQHTFIRPVFVYLVPLTRALLMFEGRSGLLASLSIWLGVVLNIWDFVWSERLKAAPAYGAILRDGFTSAQATALKSEFQNYLLFFLAPYAVTVALSYAIAQQAAHRRRVETLYDELRGAHEELKALHARVHETAVTEERNRLAREIHDSLAHYLTVINVQLEAADKLYPSEVSQEQVRRARRLTLDCLQEVRRSVAALRAASLEDLSIQNALRRLADEFAEHTGISVTASIRLSSDWHCSPETALALYRAAQEGLTNVYRHAQAANASISLTQRDGTIELTVQDDGVGPPESPAGEGFGLIGLRERLALLNGSVCFERVPDGGARLVISLPVAGDRPRAGSAAVV